MNYFAAKCLDHLFLFLDASSDAGMVSEDSEGVVKEFEDKSEDKIDKSINTDEKPNDPVNRNRHGRKRQRTD